MADWLPRATMLDPICKAIDEVRQYHTYYYLPNYTYCAIDIYHIYYLHTTAKQTRKNPTTVFNPLFLVKICPIFDGSAPSQVLQKYAGVAEHMKT